MKLVKLFSAIALICSASAACAATVSTDGSTSMEKVVGILSESYHNLNPDVQVTYNPTGSGAGIAAALEGRADIGLSSRALKDEEQEKLVGTTVALDGIVMVVHTSNPVSDLSLEQIASLYKGEVDNWQAVGGADAPVVLIGREAGSGTRDGFETVTHTKDQCKYRQELTSTGDVITTVSQNPNAVGYASLSAVSKKIKVVSVNGVTASESTVQDGSYALQRPFVYVTLKDKPLNPDARRFFDYSMSKQVEPLLIKAGVVPTVK